VHLPRVSKVQEVVATIRYIQMKHSLKDVVFKNCGGEGGGGGGVKLLFEIRNMGAEGRGMKLLFANRTLVLVLYSRISVKTWVKEPDSLQARTWHSTST
jgi:hypothetical protein